MIGLRHILLVAALLLATPAQAAIELDRVRVTHLDNGLTLLILEDHTLPVVSVQSAYKTGGRDDPEGRMGLAHFFEHMAFRSSKNFPDNGLVKDIYAAGGEWHGYTWIDTITFFATAPKDDLDLLLRIEADRLGRLRLEPEVVTAEIGAVIAEMNGYANDPATVLFDATLAAAFNVHPYRKNTIGYEGDVSAITHDDIVAFYKTRIGPKTAVLAIAGDVDADAVEARVKKIFGKLKGKAEPVLPPDSEPTVTGEKRVRLEGATQSKLFRIAYPAPAASSDDYPAFLVLQALAGASSGVSFLQNDWGTPVAKAASLAGITSDIATWFIPTAQSYVFLVAGSAGSDADEIKIENAIQRALDGLAANAVSDERLAAAKKQILRELVLDVETTEDAAHQLAYFEAIGALDQLLSLNEKIAEVTAEDIQRVADIYLRHNRRTIGWFVSGSDRTPPPAEPVARLTMANARPGEAAPANDPAGVLQTRNGVIVRQSPLSPTVAIKTVLPGRYACALCNANDPAPGVTSVSVKGLNGEFDELLAQIQAAIASATPSKEAPATSNDPSTRLEQIIASQFEAGTIKAAPLPVFAAIAGDVDPKAAAEKFSAKLGAPQPLNLQTSLRAPTGDVIVSIPEDKAQAAIGYMAAAPARSDPQALAWEMALYLFAHDYGGRLGDEAISNRGLAYYIGADYRTGTNGGLISLSIGVDPAKQDALENLMRAELKRFVAEPPGTADLAEAKRHLIGRRISAAQSNEELTVALADRWARHDMMSTEDYAAAVKGVTLEQVHAILPAFAGGDMIVVKVGADQRAK
ncbi:M16 family metallopeptidase [Hyphococcus sp.]|uniref:M16 family metallopeptidase n=1 Tax=Hyphococcus sp. TaxID=2038636 RepID=UPI002089A999|nr:MAG: hypothetical protein DHS20C04_02010 [Marinicaulis sp.]